MQKVFNERQLKQGEEEVSTSKWRAFVEQKDVRRKLWAAFGMEQFVRRMWERFTIEQAWARSVSADAEGVRQNGTDGRWQHETPDKEELELVRHSNDLRLGGVLMRPVFYAVKPGDRRNYPEDISGNGHQILNVLVPQMREQFGEVPKMVSHDRIQRRTVEQIVGLPVPKVEE